MEVEEMNKESSIPKKTRLRTATAAVALSCTAAQEIKKKKNRQNTN
jgi:hypothetical protein